MMLILVMMKMMMVRSKAVKMLFVMLVVMIEMKMAMVMIVIQIAMMVFKNVVPTLVMVAKTIPTSAVKEVRLSPVDIGGRWIMVRIKTVNEDIPFLGIYSPPRPTNTKHKT